MYYGTEGFEQHGMPEGSLLTIEFTLENMKFTGLNGGPAFEFTPATSFMINCNGQEEVDYFWDRLGEGGDPEAQQCGWLKDKFGISWQVIPTEMLSLLNSPDKDRVGKAMAAMMQMKKLDIGVLKKAYNN